MAAIKGFITNLGKYNEGTLEGEWIEFPISEDELQAVYNRIGSNEEYEEVFFTDWDCEYSGMAEYFGEYVNIDDVNEIAETIEAFSLYETEIFEKACEVWNFSEVIESNLDDYYFIDANDDDELGRHFAYECDCIDFSKFGVPENYFDFESYGRDIRYDFDGDYCTGGFIYRY